MHPFKIIKVFQFSIDFKLIEILFLNTQEGGEFITLRAVCLNEC
jgi:hypothetical protein